MGKSEEINQANLQLAERLRGELDDARARLDAANGALAEAQAERDAALDAVVKLQGRLSQAEVDSKRVPLSAGY